MRAADPRLVVAVVTALGTAGDEADRTGFDLTTFFGRGAVMGLPGEPDGPVQRGAEREARDVDRRGQHALVPQRREQVAEGVGIAPRVDGHRARRDDDLLVLDRLLGHVDDDGRVASAREDDNAFGGLEAEALDGDGAAVHPREVVKRALAHNAAAVIVAHNHPSGVAEPSRADRHLTDRLRDALALVDVRVLDHLVVGDGEIVSFAERGLL